MSMSMISASAYASILMMNLSHPSGVVMDDFKLLINGAIQKVDGDCPHCSKPTAFGGGTNNIKIKETRFVPLRANVYQLLLSRLLSTSDHLLLLLNPMKVALSASPTVRTNHSFVSPSKLHFAHMPFPSRPLLPYSTPR